MTDIGIEKPRTALIAGATGLVGSSLLDSLLSSEAYEKVISIGRRKLPFSHPKLEQHTVDFGQLPAGFAANGIRADDYFCCLGTTIAKAGSEAGFRKVDYEYVLALAQEAEKAGAQFLVVSSLGADPASRIFYNRTKGEVEQALKKLKLPALHIFRPSLLVGRRKEMRLGELLAKSISQALPFLFISGLRKYKPIPASLVAGSMLQAALHGAQGTHLHESEEMLRGSL